MLHNAALAIPILDVPDWTLPILDLPDWTLPILDLPDWIFLGNALLKKEEINTNLPETSA
jgi:hypothetical protein